MLYKRISINNKDFEDKIKELVQKAGGKVKVNPKNNMFIYTIDIPGQKSALINVYETPKGLSIYTDVGENRELSTEIAKRIIEECEVAESRQENFYNVDEDIIKIFLSEYNEYILDVEDNTIEKVIKLKDNKSKVICHWYKNKKHLLLQGIATPFWKTVYSWFIVKLKHDLNEVIILISSNEEFQKYKIQYDEEFITREITNLMGESYNGLQDYQQNWLKISYFLLNLNIDLPDYSAPIFNATKIVEGLLRKILFELFFNEAFNPSNKSFICFEKGTLKPEFSKKVPQTKKGIIEELYEFYYFTRNNLFHDSGFGTILVNKEDAKKDFDKILELIKKYHESWN
jgi:hypothetical protein